MEVSTRDFSFGRRTSSLDPVRRRLAQKRPCGRRGSVPSRSWSSSSNAPLSVGMGRNDSSIATGRDGFAGILREGVSHSEAPSKSAGNRESMF